MNQEDNVQIVYDLFRELASEETRDRVLDARTLILQCHRDLLLESGQIHVRMAKKENVDATPKRFLNQCLNLVECYLIALECALKKIDILRVVLDTSVTIEKQEMENHLAYQKMLEDVLYVEMLRAKALIQEDSSVSLIVKPDIFLGPDSSEGEGVLFVFLKNKQ